jgi:putative colanic acid biosynthesis UDP-glucose lipid carrier transferase
MDDRVLPFPPVQAGNKGLIEILRSVADPTISAACLVLSTLAWHQILRPAELVLAVMIFLMQYPSNAAFGHRERDLVRNVIGSWLVVTGLLWVLGTVTGLIDLYDRQVMVSWVIATPIAQIALHWISPLILQRVVVMRGIHRVVVVGANDLGRAFVKSITQDPLAHTQVLAFFDDREASRLGPMPEQPLAGKISEVGPFVRKHGVDQIYIALPMASQPRILDLLNDLRDTTASIYFVPDIFMFDLIQARVDTMGGFPIVAVCESPFQGTRGAIKRIFDVVVSLVAITLSAPLLVAIALAVKLSSPGPVIFRQRRFGLDGQEIMVYKFRSMSVTEDGQKQYKQVTRGDPRVTRVGAFIRKTSLDELPQFFNVLQGRMSVVGPRPHAIAVNDQFRKLIPGYMIRHKVRPGITGWAQVHGYRGGDDLGSMSKRIEFDLDYLRNWSVWMDLRIIARTVGVVFRDTKAF